MNNKKVNRLRRAKRSRKILFEHKMPRLSTFRSGKHIYAQIISADGKNILASASTLEKDMRKKKIGKNIEGAKMIGALIGERAKKKNVDVVGFDRSGFKYHGCIKALAEAAREKGLQF